MERKKHQRSSSHHSEDDNKPGLVAPFPGLSPFGTHGKLPKHPSYDTFYAHTSAQTSSFDFGWRDFWDDEESEFHGGRHEEGMELIEDVDWDKYCTFSQEGTDVGGQDGMSTELDGGDTGGDVLGQGGIGTGSTIADADGAVTDEGLLGRVGVVSEDEKLEAGNSNSVDVTIEELEHQAVGGDHGSLVSLETSFQVRSNALTVTR